MRLPATVINTHRLTAAAKVAPSPGSTPNSNDCIARPRRVRDRDSGNHAAQCEHDALPHHESDDRALLRAERKPDTNLMLSL